MKTVVVTDQNQKWFEIPDATVLTARRYLAEPESGNEGAVRVLNLCRTGRYQGRGYYVSLVAQDRAFLLEAVKSFMAETSVAKRQGAKGGRPRLAILWDPNEPHKPSNEEALQRFVKAAPLVGLEAELIDPEALERLAEFDALFNRAGPVGIIYE